MVEGASLLYMKVSLTKGMYIFVIVIKKDTGERYAMKCLKKDKIKREGKLKHVANERKVLELIREARDRKSEYYCPFLV